MKSEKYAIRKLKSGKGDGYDGLTSDYRINGTQLSILFSLMLSHCSTPKSFCMSNMVPIPKKDSGSMEDIRNYRGIALSSLLSKIFDNCVINNQNKNLCSSDLHFAYKSKISTIHCVNSVYETINHYVSNSSAVYVCTLDASKAFDRVNLLTVFEKLNKRSICPLFLRFLMHSYCNQKMHIKWNSALSGTFKQVIELNRGVCSLRYCLLFTLISLFYLLRIWESDVI